MLSLIFLTHCDANLYICIQIHYYTHFAKQALEFFYAMQLKLALNVNLYISLRLKRNFELK